MTYSLVARCATTGQFGVAVVSSSPAVGARCAHGRAGVGAVASQNVTDPALGPRLLGLMADGLSAADAVARVALTAPHIDYRQLLAVDRNGGTGIHTGARALGLWAEAAGRDVASGGNLLADPGIAAAVVRGFETATGPLGDRLIAALRAGRDAGGEAGPTHSAGMKIVDRLDWPCADLRCDWTDACPVEALADLWARYAPQMGDYVRRAEDPGAAPSYRVPGDA